jgi:predicted DNA-binding transcriptional regulator YafY
MRPGPRPAINLSILSQLREAIITRRKVRVFYTYRGSRKRGYQIVQPYGFLYGTRHYLVAWSEVDRARDFRKFALSNIERVELLAQTFTRKRGFSIQQYAEASFGVFHEDPVDVVWRFSPKVASDAAEFLFHPYQIMEPQPDGSLIVRFRAGGILEMSWHLFTWGDGVEIVKPRRLASLLERQCRDQLRRRGRKANAAG